MPQDMPSLSARMLSTHRYSTPITLGELSGGPEWNEIARERMASTLFRAAFNPIYRRGAMTPLPRFVSCDQRRQHLVQLDSNIRLAYFVASSSYG